MRMSVCVYVCVFNGCLCVCCVNLFKFENTMLVVAILLVHQSPVM